jgi:hypothetical protein
VPFGSEYSILIKNLHSTRAVVNVFIDGVNQTPSGLVIDAGRECDFERSLLNGSLNAGNKFKFIERTAGIEQHRGVQLEDGLVKIEYQFEAAMQPRSYVTTTNLVHDHYYNGIKVGTSNHPLNVNKSWLSASGSSVNAYNSSIATSHASFDRMGGGGDQPIAGVYNVGGIARSADMSNGQMTGAIASAAIAQTCKDLNMSPTRQTQVHDGCATMDMGFNDSGITVSGSKSTQKFGTTYMGAMDPEKFSMIIKLLGETPDNKPVLKPVTVKSKAKCVTCGTQNKATAHFCTKCGTALEIFA